MASPDVVWQVIRKNNSFLVKRDGATFTREPLNLVNKHSFKHSGLANKRAVGVTFGPNGEVVFQKKSGKANVARKPASLYKSATLKRDMRRVTRTIRGQTAGANFRADLTKLAQARACRVKQAQSKKTSN